MANKNFLMPECWTEKALLEILGFQEQQIQKCQGKPDVIHKQSNKLMKGKLLIGLVDFDTAKIKSTKYADYKIKHTKSFGFSVKQKTGQRHFLIELHDNFEKWIIEINRKPKVSYAKYHLSPNTLHEETSEDISTNYLSFIREIQKKYPAPFNTLKHLIIDLTKNQSAH